MLRDRCAARALSRVHLSIAGLHGSGDPTGGVRYCRQSTCPWNVDWLVSAVTRLAELGFHLACPPLGDDPGVIPRYGRLHGMPEGHPSIGSHMIRSVFTGHKLEPDSATPHPEDAVSSGGIRQRWADWVPYAAVLWSLGYGIVALVWTVTRSGFPLGENDPDWTASILAGVPARVGAPLFLVVALVSVGVAAATAWVGRRGGVKTGWRRSVIVFGAVVAGWWILIVPDARVLAVVGYLPMIVILAAFSPEIRASLADGLSIVHLNHLAVITGGFLLALATLAFTRRTSAQHLGGVDRKPDRTTRSVARWARPAVYVAAAIPAVYAATRIAWAVGTPLGIRDDLFEAGVASGELAAGAWLASFGLVGSLLTFGLISPWGEVFPRWLPLLGDRRVPIGLAVVPATMVSALVFSAGLGASRAAFTGDTRLSTDNWAELGPTLLWPLWGIALAVATLAYYLRRRTTS